MRLSTAFAQQAQANNSFMASLQGAASISNSSADFLKGVVNKLSLLPGMNASDTLTSVSKTLNAQGFTTQFTPKEKPAQIAQQIMEPSQAPASAPRSKLSL